MSSESITLRHGPSVPTEAISLFLGLSERGFVLRAEDGKLKLAGDPSSLTAEDRAAITRYKFHLLGLIDYCESGVADR